MNPQSRRTLLTGNSMPVIGLGTWKLTIDTDKVIAAAMKAGYAMIDTSGDYGTQPGIAKGLELSGADRDSYYIVTKVEEDEDAYKSAKHQVDELGLEYADLILIHRPPQDGSAGHSLWEGLIQAREDGITKDIGVSNYSVEQIEELAHDSGVMPVVNQIEWTPFGYSPRMHEFCQDNNIIIQSYSPLTRGELLDNDVLNDIADYHERSPAQVLLRWNLQLGVVPLPKANQLRHAEENLNIFDFELSRRDMETLSNLNNYYSALSSGSLAYVNQ